MPEYLATYPAPAPANGDCGCSSRLAGERAERSRLRRAKLLGAYQPQPPIRIRPGPEPIRIFPTNPTGNPPIANPYPFLPISTSPSGSAPTNTSRSWQGRARRDRNFQNSPQYQAYQNWLATQGANSPSTAYGSTIQNYDSSGNPVYSVAPVGESVIGYDTQGNPVYGSAQQNSNVAPASVSVSTTPSTSSYQSILDWFTDPSQELISGIPNWVDVVALGAAWLFFTRNKNRGRY